MNRIPVISTLTKNSDNPDLKNIPKSLRIDLSIGGTGTEVWIAGGKMIF